MMNTPRPFPIPLVPLGPGSQSDDEPLAFIAMPKDMSTYQPPPLPEPEALAAHGDALAALQAAHAALRRKVAGEAVAPIDITALPEADRALVNQVLGEGEVAAQVQGPDGLQAQESVFAGLWRVLHLRGGQVLRDQINQIEACELQVAALERHFDELSLRMDRIPAVLDSTQIKEQGMEMTG